MRWTVIGLLICNVIFLLWNWLEYSHSKGVSAMNPGLDAAHPDMPGAKVVLLREMRQGATDIGVSIATTTAVQQAGSGPLTEALAVSDSKLQEQQLCLLLGPLSDPGAAKTLLDRLTALQIRGKYAAVQVEGAPDYWVYLRPEPTKELATARLRELQEKKIDSFIVPQGEIANGISLGVFDRRENAEKRQQDIVSMGYDAQLRANPRNYLENWIVIYPDESAKFSPELYSQLRLDNNMLDLRKEECAKVASEVDIH